MKLQYDDGDDWTGKAVYVLKLGAELTLTLALAPTPTLALTLTLTLTRAGASGSRRQVSQRVRHLQPYAAADDRSGRHAGADGRRCACSRPKLSLALALALTLRPDPPP